VYLPGLSLTVTVEVPPGWTVWPSLSTPLPSIAIACGSESELPFASLIVTVPALAVNVLFEKPRPPLSVASIASTVAPPLLVPVLPVLVVSAPLDCVLGLAPAELEPDVVELVSLDPPPHAASTRLTAASAATSMLQRRNFDIDTAIAAPPGFRVRLSRLRVGADPSQR
jgi:hypothetical protein